ncbi:MAG: BolA family protein [Woeseiaceae bacterium]
MTAERVDSIKAALAKAFSPTELLVKDQSHLHAGHEGARSGGGHFDVRIVSAAFDGKRMLQRHRMVFEALDSMMESEIHALRITARTPEET